MSEKLNSLWSNKKTGDEYVLLHIGQDTQTLEKLVIYRRLDTTEDSIIHVVPYIKFLRNFEEVDPTIS